jgi:hypothetical protein
MDDFISKTVINLQLVCHFMNSHHSALEYHCTNLFIVLCSHEYGWVPDHSLSVIPVQILLSISPHLHALLQQKSPYRADSL